jgi:hypothetical protein
MILTLHYNRFPPGESVSKSLCGIKLLTAYEGMKSSTTLWFQRGAYGNAIGDLATKFPSKHMGNGGLTSDPRAYELIGVPWTTFFHDAGIAFHGTFWHDNFGTPMSHGCVNLPNADALWLFRWTSPPYTLEEGEKPLWKVSAKQTPELSSKDINNF